MWIVSFDGKSAAAVHYLSTVLFLCICRPIRTAFVDSVDKMFFEVLHVTCWQQEIMNNQN